MATTTVDLATCRFWFLPNFAVHKITKKMNIVITGSLGRISKPLVQELIEKGHAVTVISSKAERAGEIEAVGATPAVGAVEDTEFLAQTFMGADIVYLMEPPLNFTNPGIDILEAWVNIGRSFKKAVAQSGVRQIIHLSSIGGHTDTGNGMLAAHHHIENLLNELPESVAIKFMRPVGFYYNTFAFIPTIKASGSIYQNYSGDIKEPWVSPLDIAATIAEEMELPFDGRTVRYIASEELTGKEVAKILGDAIGVPDIKWVEIPDAAFEENLIKAGLTAQAAKGFADMNAGRREGLYNDYNANKPILGKVKLADFAKDFAFVYHQ
ncbi:NmrA family NAD(P)-binding protein [Flavobacterium sp. RHBU_3]|uniref:NmrA family NAD(P)-binding protein n=1 Tax=Flavobacterium sp. RHBU_3 TaxID=3391184 RepID=UPI0039848125